jgi:hypothetical protein
MNNRGRPVGSSGGPLVPEKVLEIVRMKDDCNMTFREIADRVGGTRMNCCSLYNRWIKWARAQRTAAE